MKTISNARKRKHQAPRATVPALPDVPTVRDVQNAVKVALLPSANAAAVISRYAGEFGLKNEDTQALMERLWGDIQDMCAGDMKRVEAMLFGQAHALQTIFMAMARRAEAADIKNGEPYLRMAFKAQNQCRMTLESLATIKNPPVVFARQANINNGGQQQVNNGAESTSLNSTRAPHAPAPAANHSTEKTELLETTDGERLDFGAQGQAVGADPVLAPVGTIDGAAHR